MTYTNGETYEGQWQANLREGYGKLVKADGTVYEGAWKKDKMNGLFEVTEPDGTVKEYKYVNGKRIK